MKEEKILIGLLIEEKNSLSFTEVCQRYHIPEALLEEMIGYGLFPDQPISKEQIQLNQKALSRIESAFRLHRDLGINLAGVALALDLLEQIERMHQELDIFRKHFSPSDSNLY